MSSDDFKTPVDYTYEDLLGCRSKLGECISSETKATINIRKLGEVFEMKLVKHSDRTEPYDYYYSFSLTPEGIINAVYHLGEKSHISRYELINVLWPAIETVYNRL